MSSLDTWWKLWAPYWARLEDRHLSTFVTDTFLDGVKGPALVVGAGQGLIVERLRNRGVATEGVDLAKEMIVEAKSRRGIALILADAAKLPFADESFQTVVIATGVIDYLDDVEVIAKIVAEAKRVIVDGGELIMTFYKLEDRIVRIYRRLGVLTPDGRYRLQRIFEIMKAYEKSPRHPIALIANWTKRSLLSTAGYWSLLGLTLPASMRREQKEMRRIFRKAESAGQSAESLIATVPASLPYREESEVFELVERMGIHTYAASTGADCTVIRHHRFSNLDNLNAPYLKSTPSDCIIRTNKLTKVFGGGGMRAVDGLSISVKKGTIYGILGPNGAGKTTTLGMLSGLIAPTEGDIVFAAGLERKNIKKEIGYVPQKLALYERLSALENLRFFGSLYGITGEHFQKRSQVVLDMVGLTARAKEPISNFSGGMLRRLNLAAGLLHEPKIILLDEPTVGIDPQSRNRIFDAVLELKANGATVLYTTHYMEEAMNLCDTIAIMDHGRVVLENSPADALRELGLSEIQFIVDRPLTAAAQTAVAACPGVHSIVAGPKILIVRARPAKAGAALIQAVEAAVQGKVKLTLKCFVEPTLEKLFLDITGRSLRDEKERS